MHVKHHFIDKVKLYYPVKNGLLGSRLPSSEGDVLEYFNFAGLSDRQYPSLPVKEVSLRRSADTVIAELAENQRRYRFEGNDLGPEIDMPYSGLSDVLSDDWWLYYNDGDFYTQHTSTKDIPWRLDAALWCGKNVSWCFLDGELYGVCDQSIERIDFATGEVLWSVPVPENFEVRAAQLRPIISDGQRLFINLEGCTQSVGMLMAIDVDSGAVLWQKTPEATGGYCYDVASDDLVSYLGKIYHCVDATTGATRLAKPGNRDFEVDLLHQGLIGEYLFYIGRSRIPSQSGIRDQYELGLMDLKSGEKVFKDTFVCPYQINRFFQYDDKFYVNFGGEGVRIFELVTS